MEELDGDNNASSTASTQKTKESSNNPDSILDDIVDDIDITTLLSKDELAAKDENCQRVLSAAKDFDPVEREKAKAKRKSLEQEIVRQTEEFDRLAAVSKTKKSTLSKEEPSPSSASADNDNDDVKNANPVARRATVSASTRGRVKLSKSEWVTIIRHALLVFLGGCVGK